jgi:hypothetical protein
MRKLVVTLTATAALILGSAGLAKATPLLIGAESPNQSPIESVGCTRTGDNCPIGFAIKRHGGGSWSCVPCSGKQNYGSRYRDRDEEYSEPRRYREYDERHYAPRYPREYY